MDDLKLIRLNIGEPEGKQLFSDEQLKAWLDTSAGSVNMATAKALMTIATTEALLSKKIATQNLSTDGPAVSAALREQAKFYMRQAEAETPENAEASRIIFVPNDGPWASSGEGVENRW